mmetsp:Transcript_81423/g.263719  ORF Transcript_81423/g.263719 Transcript_81423/m.263719 type:complete len:131 (-) Transcript_81423:412-804(-)
MRQPSVMMNVASPSAMKPPTLPQAECLLRGGPLVVSSGQVSTAEAPLLRLRMRFQHTAHGRWHRLLASGCVQEARVPLEPLLQRLPAGRGCQCVPFLQAALLHCRHLLPASLCDRRPPAVPRCVAAAVVC